MTQFSHLDRFKIVCSPRNEKILFSSCTYCNLSHILSAWTSHDGCDDEHSLITGMIEAYRDKYGSLAWTDQNKRLFNYGDQRITPEQRAAIMRGDRKSFWTARKKVVL